MTERGKTIERGRLGQQDNPSRGAVWKAHTNAHTHEVGTCTSASGPYGLMAMLPGLRSKRIATLPQHTAPLGCIVAVDIPRLCTAPRNATVKLREKASQLQVQTITTNGCGTCTEGSSPAGAAARPAACPPAPAPAAAPPPAQPAARPLRPAPRPPQPGARTAPWRLCAPPGPPDRPPGPLRAEGARHQGTRTGGKGVR